MFTIASQPATNYTKLAEFFERTHEYPGMTWARKIMAFFYNSTGNPIEFKTKLGLDLYQNNNLKT